MDQLTPNLQFCALGGVWWCLPDIDAWGTCRNLKSTSTTFNHWVAMIRNFRVASRQLVDMELIRFPLLGLMVGKRLMWCCSYFLAPDLKYIPNARLHIAIMQFLRVLVPWKFAKKSSCQCCFVLNWEEIINIKRLNGPMYLVILYF